MTVTRWLAVVRGVCHRRWLAPISALRTVCIAAIASETD